MGLAIETIIGYNGNLTGTTTFDALTAGANATFTVRSFVDGSNCYLEDVWASDDDSIFQLSIKSPRMHDQVKGLLLAGTNLSTSNEQVFTPQSLLPGRHMQRLYSTDVLTVTANGTAADVFNAAFNVRYENLGGISARLVTYEQIQPLIVNTLGILTAPVPSGTAGAWGAGYVFNSGDNRLKADTDYAILGYTCTRTVTAVSIVGTDTGNLFIGGPGGYSSDITGDFFEQSSRKYGRAAIPVLNSNNAGSTTVQIADILTSGTPNVTWILAQLSQKIAQPTP
jgi:hypothetical protein